MPCAGGCAVRAPALICVRAVALPWLHGKERTRYSRAMLVCAFGWAAGRTRRGEGPRAYLPTLSRLRVPAGTVPLRGASPHDECRIVSTHAAAEQRTCCQLHLHRRALRSCSSAHGHCRPDGHRQRPMQEPARSTRSTRLVQRSARRHRQLASQSSTALIVRSCSHRAVHAAPRTAFPLAHLGH